MRRASDISLTVKGQVQGDFKGGSKKKDRTNAFDVWDTNYKVVSPRDVVSGHATGRRQHNPLVVYTEVEGGAIPMCLTALTKNENLTKVEMKFWRSDAKAAKQTNYFTITLENAVLSEFEVFCDEDGRPNARLAFTFGKITLTWMDGNITSTDDWHGTQ